MSNNASDSTSEKQKKYYEQNREIICKKKRKHFNCACGGRYKYSNKARHLKTKKHQKYLKEKVVVEKMMREIITEIVNNVINHL